MDRLPSIVLNCLSYSEHTVFLDDPIFLFELIAHEGVAMSEPIAYARAHREASVAELVDFLKIPSVSSQKGHDADTRNAAQWLANRLTAAGLNHVRLIETAGQPLVYGDWLKAGADAPTVLIYGHYDVQPPEPLDLWASAPFSPVIKDDFLYARGASDDKGQVYTHVKAVEAILATRKALPVNVKFLVEGEEEVGGEAISAFIPENRELLAADIALISDTGMVSADQPAIVYGLRGLAYLFLDVTGPARDLHSGSFGGGIDNPINALCHIGARLKDQAGQVLIPGFYDRVRPLNDAERKILAGFPMDEAAWLAESGAPAVWGEADYSLVERLGARPTLDFNGIIGGYTGAGCKTVLPSTVHAKVSMRLVPDQDPEEIAQLFQDYIQKITPPTVRAQVTLAHGAAASITDLSIPAIKAAEAALETSFGNRPVLMREGGSIPVVGLFQTHLKLETILMGFGLAGDKIHAPNERFYLPNFHRGIEASIAFLTGYGTRP
jgi:acetylornithine deacetylase/succinyl-diaminopimelate desuccinylase-like protein